MRNEEQGKYSIIKEGKKTTTMDELLLEQSKLNELAEANRLKRLELLALHVMHNIPELPGSNAFDDKAGYVQGWNDYPDEKPKLEKVE